MSRYSVERLLPQCVKLCFERLAHVYTRHNRFCSHFPLDTTGSLTFYTRHRLVEMCLDIRRRGCYHGLYSQRVLAGVFSRLAFYHESAKATAKTDLNFYYEACSHSKEENVIRVISPIVTFCLVTTVTRSGLIFVVVVDVLC